MRDDASGLLLIAANRLWAAPAAKAGPSRALPLSISSGRCRTPQLLLGCGRVILELAEQGFSPRVVGKWTIGASLEIQPPALVRQTSAYPRFLRENSYPKTSIAPSHHGSCSLYFA